MLNIKGLGTWKFWGKYICEIKPQNAVLKLAKFNVIKNSKQRKLINFSAIETNMKLTLPTFYFYHHACIKYWNEYMKYKFPKMKNIPTIYYCKLFNISMWSFSTRFSMMFCRN